MLVKLTADVKQRDESAGLEPLSCKSVEPWKARVIQRLNQRLHSPTAESVCDRSKLLAGGFHIIKKKLSKLFSENNYWENGLTVRKGHVLMKSFLKECNLTRIANCRIITVQCARGVFTHHCWTACCQFAQQGWIKLIETDSEGFYNVTKDFYRFLKLSTL